MAVDLGDVIESLKREINIPGGDNFTAATDDMYLGYLQDAFWEARLDGITVLAQWDELDGNITPVVVGGADITRDLLQLLVLIGGMRILRNDLLFELSQNFRAKAGPVEFETTGGTSVLVAVLKDLQAQRNILLTRLSDLGAIPTYYFDALIERETSLAFGLSDYPSGGYGGVTGAGGGASGGYDGGYYGGGW